MAENMGYPFLSNLNVTHARRSLNSNAKHT
jgi:hypothetical protein